MITYTFADGTFTFWTVKWDSGKYSYGIFRVREDRTPCDRAKEKGLTGYDRIEAASKAEIELWFLTHIGFEPISMMQKDGIFPSRI